MSVVENRATRDRLFVIDQQLKVGKRAREEARNLFEGYLSRVKDLLEDSWISAFHRMCLLSTATRLIDLA